MQRVFTSTPPWAFPPPNIRLDLASIPKTDNSSYLRLIRSLIDEYPDHTLCFTDGSKIKPRTGYAYSIQDTVYSYRLRNSASIFTAELTAILSCLSHLASLPPKSNFLLFSDSLSSLQAIQDPYSHNPLTQLIYTTLLTLTSNQSSVTLFWIPGHIDLPEHDAVDQAAKSATSLPKITDPRLSPSSDLKNSLKSLIYSSWHSSWDSQSTNKLRQIKPKPIPWQSSYRTSRHEETLLSRLRIGHTRLTHAYLFLDLLSPADCPYCRLHLLSVDHFFTCPQLQPLRNSHQVPSNTPAALANNHSSITNTLQYLRSTKFSPFL